MLIGPSRVRAAPPDPRPRAARHGGSPTCPHRGPRATRGILGRRNTMRSRGLRDLNPGPAPNPALHRIRGLVTTRSWVYLPGRRNGMCRKGLPGLASTASAVRRPAGRRDVSGEASAGRLRGRGPPLILPCLLPARTPTGGFGKRHLPGPPDSATAERGRPRVPVGSGSARMCIRPCPSPAGPLRRPREPAREPANRVAPECRDQSGGSSPGQQPGG